MIFRQTELDHDHGDQQCRSVEREGPRIGKKVMNEGSRRGARGGLWGLLPSSVSGKRVGAGVQPQLIQGIRRRDSVGKGQGTTA